jgi:hypothetical protein
MEVDVGPPFIGSHVLEEVTKECIAERKPPQVIRTTERTSLYE